MGPREAAPNALPASGWGGYEKQIRVLFCAALIIGGFVLAPLAFGQGVGYLKANIDPGRAGVFVEGKYLGAGDKFRCRAQICPHEGETCRTQSANTHFLNNIYTFSSLRNFGPSVSLWRLTFR